MLGGAEGEAGGAVRISVRRQKQESAIGRLSFRSTRYCPSEPVRVCAEMKKTANHLDLQSLNDALAVPIGRFLFQSQFGDMQRSLRVSRMEIKPSKAGEVSS